MRGFNKVIIMGNLAKDPDVRVSQGGLKNARITVAVGSSWKDKQTGEKVERADFISVVAWRFTADLCEKYLTKGKPVLVEGRLSVRDFDDVKTGQHRWVTEVIADNIVLLGSGRKDGEYPSDYAANTRRAGSTRPTPSYDGVQGDMGSLRGEVGFEEEFPLDFSGVSGGDVDIPF